MATLFVIVKNTFDIPTYVYKELFFRKVVNNLIVIDKLPRQLYFFIAQIL